MKVNFERLYFAYHRSRNIWPIWYYWLNRESRKLWDSYPHILSSAQTEAVSALKRDGIAVMHISRFFPDAGFFDLLKKQTLKRLQDFEADRSIPFQPAMRAKGYNKDFMAFLWGGGGTYPLLDVGNPFIRLALDEKILTVAGAYLGLCPKLQGFSLQSTRLIPAGTPERLSQRWHRDPDDKKIMKVFLYLNDVEDGGAGPFMYVRGSHYGGKWRHIFPQRLPVGRYPELGAVERIVPPDDVRACLGKAGTIIFCDTSGLHRGGYSTTKARLMFATGFVSNASCQPINYKRPEEIDMQDFCSLAEYALRP